MIEDVKIKEGGKGATGLWSAFSLRPDIQASDPIVSRLRDISRGRVPAHEGEKYIRDLKEQKVIIKEVQQYNIVPTVGRNVLARLLTGDTTYSGEINYMALGTGTAAFTNASTFLTAEVFRKLVSDAAFDDNIAYIDGFIASGDVADGTYTEAGAFIDGSTGSTTGRAFSLVVQNFVKSGSMFISLKVTFT